MSLPELGLEGAVSRVASTDSALVMVDTQDTAVTLSLSSFSLVSKLAGYSHTANISAHSLSPDSQTCLVSYSNNRLMELNTHTGKYTQFSRQIVQYLYQKQYCFCSINSSQKSHFYYDQLIMFNI